MTILFLFCLIIWAAVADQEARLFLYKEKLTDPVVEGKDLVINYRIINRGDGPAYNIKVTDRYDPSSFDIKDIERDDQIVSFSVDEVAAQATVAINVTVVPKLFGEYNPTRARVKYSGGADIFLNVDDEDSEVEVDLDNIEESSEEPEIETGRIGYSNSLGRVKIIEAALYERQNATHYLGKALFLIMAIFAVMVPLHTYLSLKKSRIAHSRVSEEKSSKKRQ